MSLDKEPLLLIVAGPPSAWTAKPLGLEPIVPELDRVLPLTDVSVMRLPSAADKRPFGPTVTSARFPPVTANASAPRPEAETSPFTVALALLLAVTAIARDVSPLAATLFTTALALPAVPVTEMASATPPKEARPAVVTVPVEITAALAPCAKMALRLVAVSAGSAATVLTLFAVTNASPVADTAEMPAPPRPVEVTLPVVITLAAPVSVRAETAVDPAPVVETDASPTSAEPPRLETVTPLESAPLVAIDAPLPSTARSPAPTI